MAIELWSPWFILTLTYTDEGGEVRGRSMRLSRVGQFEEVLQTSELSVTHLNLIKSTGKHPSGWNFHEVCEIYSCNQETDGARIYEIIPVSGETAWLPLHSKNTSVSFTSKKKIWKQ